MPKTQPLKTNFSAGEIDPALALRRDTKQYRDGAKSLRNCRVLVGGGVRRRPGTRRLAALVGNARLEDMIVNQSTQYVLAFSNARMDAYARDTTTGLLTAAGSLTGCPWTTATFPTMDIASSGNTIIVTHPSFLKILTRTGASTWTQGDFPWYTASNGRVHQPHAKTAAFATTLTPSALTGSITLTASAAHFTSSYVGKKIRLLDRELNITAVTDSTHSTATVLEPLRPYQTLTVASSADFAVDEVVLGETSSAKGIVLAIPDATHLTVVVNEALTKFEAEDIIGPNATTACSAVADATPAATRDWSEEIFNAIHGYPTCVEIHRGRILFGGAAGLPSGLAGSSIANIYDFDVGTGADADGFLETIGDSSAVTIKRLHSAEQLLLLTDRGPYYVPESTQNPFRPTSLAFNHFGGEWPCSDVYVGAFDGGAVFVSGSIIIKMIPTGNTTAMWEAQERSFLSPHLVSAPVDALFVANYAQGPERYGMFVNNDGTMAVMQLIDAEQIRNFTPWDTEGSFKSGCALSGDVYVVVSRVVGGATVYWLEMFDDDLTLDGATEYSTESAMLVAAPALYSSSTVQVVANGQYYLGDYPPALDELPSGPYVVGFSYDREIELLPPNIEDGGRNYAGEQMRILEVMVHTLESARFAINGTELQAYQVTDRPDLPPPLRTGPQRMQLLGGWQREPTVTITQPDPLALTVLGVSTRVAY